MYKGQLNIRGNRDVFLSVAPQFNKSVITVTLTTSFDGTSFSKSYNLRNGEETIDIIQDFRKSATEAAQNRDKILQRFVNRGFSEIVEPG